MICICQMWEAKTNRVLIWDSVLYKCTIDEIGIKLGTRITTKRPHNKPSDGWGHTWLEYSFDCRGFGWFWRWLHHPWTLCGVYLRLRPVVCLSVFFRTVPSRRGRVLPVLWKDGWRSVLSRFSPKAIAQRFQLPVRWKNRSDKQVNNFSYMFTDTLLMIWF